MNMGHWQGESQRLIKMLRPTEQFCAMQARHRHNEQLILYVLQFRLCKDSSIDLRLKH
jgi:hypothetical protein